MKVRPRIVVFPNRRLHLFARSQRAGFLRGAAERPAAGAAGRNGNWFSNILDTYRDKPVARMELENSPRMENLIVDGKIELTLSDALALALENNLDIAVQRFIPSFSQTDLLRSQAGQSPRGFSGATIPEG